MGLFGKSRNVGEPPYKPSDKHPMEAASWFSWTMVSWVTPMILKGAARPLEFTDLPKVPHKLNSKVTGDRVAKAWDKAWKKAQAKAAIDGTEPKVDFMWILTKCFFWEWMVCGALLMLYLIGTVFTPIIVQTLLEVIADDEYLKTNPFLGLIDNKVGLLTLFVFSLFMTSMCAQTAFMNSVYLGCQIRSSIMHIVFAKSLRLSPTANTKGSTGNIVNLMSNDSERIFMVVLNSHFLWIGPVVIVVVLAILLQTIGAAGLAGIVVTVILIPIQIKLGKSMGTEKRKMLEFSDSRVGITAEALRGVRLIKMNAWEKQMSERIAEVREEEMKSGRNMLFLMTINSWLLFVAPTIIALAVFGVYIFTIPDEFSVNLVFSTLAFVAILRFPLNILPRAVSSFAQASVSTKRIKEFLSLPEIGKDALLSDVDAAPSSDSNGPEEVGKPVVVVKDGTFTWSEHGDPSPTAVLRDINLNINRGELVAIVGKVASGKSSLCSTLLNEIGVISGSVSVNLPPEKHDKQKIENKKSSRRGGIAYVAQESWIQNATVRENIVFQSAQAVSSLQVNTKEAQQQADPVDEELFRRCVRVAELKADIKILPNGVNTEIGDRGVNLSGGQKSRIAIARALYRALNRDLDMVVMDDCFSALDPQVGLKIFQQLVLEQLAGKTRLVVLNSQMHLLEKFDRIIALDDGKIVLDLPAQEALRDPRLEQIVAVAVSDEVADDAESGSASGASSSNDDYKLNDGPEVVVDHARPESALSQQSRPESSRMEVVSQEDRLYKLENRTRGDISKSSYLAWLKASFTVGKLVPVFSVMFLAFILSQLSKVGSELWLGEWAERSLNIPTGLGVYGGIIAIMVVFVLVRGLLFMEIAVRAAIAIHNGLIFNILRAPVNTFFDVTPAGRIINRISHDLDKVDQTLPEQLFNFVSNTLQIVAILVICALSSFYFLAILVPVMFVFIQFGRYFAKSSRELKRMESIAKSPLFSNFSETLAGIDSIRAFALEDDINRKNEYLINHNHRAFLMFWMSSRWLALRLDLLVVVLQASVTILALTLAQDGVSSNVTKLAVVYSLQLTGMMQFTIRLMVEVQNSFTSVERLNFLTKSIPQEKPVHIKETLPSDPNWPARGDVFFENVSMRYRPELPLVLKNVSFQIKAGQHCGVCGRTGAGKSSIAQALFRMVDPITEGRIVIDGVDISKLGVVDLRSKLGIIPQNPVIFSGSLRFNLDPWNKHSDEQIMDALKRVQLPDLATGPDGLLMPLHDQGSNLSVGERQLISIARTILQGARVIMADEATANVDTLSDALVQETIREQFKTQTTITIAHRLQTIADSDVILVLSFGEVAEFDSPENLLANGNSMFAGMMRDSNM